MGGSVSEFLLLFTGNSESAEAAMAKVDAGMSGMQEQGSGLMSKLGKVFLAIAAAALAVGVAFSAVALKMASDYQESTAKIAANSGSTIAAAQAVTQAFLTTAGQSTFSAQEMAAAYASAAGQFTLLNGTALSAAQAMDVMKASTMGAEATGGDLNSTTQALASTLLAFHLPVSDAATVMGQLVNVSRLTGQPISDVATAVDKLKARLGELAPSVSDVGTLMVQLDAQGLQGSRGMQIANTAMQTLLGGTTAVTTALSNLGVSVYTASGQFVGWQSVVEQLQPKLAGMTQAQQDLYLKTLFGASAAQVMGGIIQQGLPGYQNASSKVNDLAKAHQAAADNADTLAGRLRTAKAAVDDFTVKVGNELLPVVEAAVSWFSSRLIPALTEAAAWLGKNLPLAIQAVEKWFNQNKGTIQTVAGILGGALHLAISAVVTVLGFLYKNLQWIGPVLGGVVVGMLALKAAMALQAFLAAPGIIAAIAGVLAGGLTPAEAAASMGATDLGAAIDTATGLIGWIVLAIAAVIAIGLLLITHWKQVTAIAKTVWKDVSGFFESLWHDVSGFFTSLWHDIVSIWNGIVQAIEGAIGTITSAVGNFIGGVVNFFTQLPGKILTAMAGLDKTLVGFFGGVWKDITGAVSTFVGGVVNFFKDLPGNIVTALGNLLTKVGGFLSGVWNSLLTDVTNFIGITGGGGIIGFFKDLPGNIASAMGKMVSTVLNAVKNAANSIPVIGGALKAIGLAAGDIVTKPTFALLGEEETEYVIPESQLGKAGSAGVKGLFTSGGGTPALSQTLGMAGAGASGSGGGTQINLGGINVQGLTTDEVMPAVRQELSSWAGQIARLTHR